MLLLSSAFTSRTGSRAQAKTESKAKAEEALTQAKADLKATMSALEQLASYAADVHQSCDFVSPEGAFGRFWGIFLCY